MKVVWINDEHRSAIPGWASKLVENMKGLHVVSMAAAILYVPDDNHDAHACVHTLILKGAEDSLEPFMLLGALDVLKAEVLQAIEFDDGEDDA